MVAVDDSEVRPACARMVRIDREYTLTAAEFPRSILSDPEVWVDTIGGEGEAIFLPERYFPHGPVSVQGSIP